MAFNKDQIVIGAGSDFAWAPKGTAVAATSGTLTGALPTGFKDFGGVSDDGVEINRSADWNAKKLWQTDSNVLWILQGVELTLACSLSEANKSSYELYFGCGPDAWVETTTGSGIFRLDIPAQPDKDDRAFLWKWHTGSRHYALIVPDGSMTDQDSITLQRTDTADANITISANDSGSGVLAYILTDDTAMDPAA